LICALNIKGSTVLIYTEATVVQRLIFRAGMIKVIDFRAPLN